jgi:hypothetical protein
MGTREQIILLVSDDAELCAAARQEFGKIDERLRVSAVSTVDAARRVVEHTAPSVILLEDTPSAEKPANEPHGSPRLDAEVSYLAVYAPVVVIGDADRQTQMSDLIGAGVADYVVRKPDCLSIALGLVERRLRQAQFRPPTSLSYREEFGASSESLPPEGAEGDFGAVLRHELNNPLTGILGNAELLLAEIRRKNDGRLPQGAQQRLETIAGLAVRLRETVRRLSQEWQERHPMQAP